MHAVQGSKAGAVLCCPLRSRLTITSLVVGGARCRRAHRLTLVKGMNMAEVHAYAKLIDLGQPDFIEIKGVTFCGAHAKGPPQPSGRRQGAAASIASPQRTQCGQARRRHSCSSLHLASSRHGMPGMPGCLAAAAASCQTPRWAAVRLPGLCWRAGKGAGKDQLSMEDNVPFHHEVVAFSQALCEARLGESDGATGPLQWPGGEGVHTVAARNVLGRGMHPGASLGDARLTRRPSRSLPCRRRVRAGVRARALVLRAAGAPRPLPQGRALAHLDRLRPLPAAGRLGAALHQRGCALAPLLKWT